MGLTYRLYKDDDFQELERLWRESAEWGHFTAEMYRKYFQNAPCGSPLIALAADENSGQVLGQLAFVPNRLMVNGREFPAFRPAAPILDKRLRSRSLNPLQHPIVELYSFAIRSARDRGHGLTFALPDPRWMLLIRMLPGNICGVFPLWSLPLPLPKEFKHDSSYTVGQLAAFDERVDRLWNTVSRQTRCQLVRDRRELSFKASPPEYSVLGVERQGELVGLVCSRQKGDRQWLICDMLAADEGARRETLMAVANFAHARSLEAGAQSPIAKIAILATPPMQPALTTLGFHPDKYNFHLVIRVIDSTISKEDVEPNGWYLSAND